jgi:hypothetical protein
VQDDDKEEYEETEKDSGEECKVDFGTAHSPLDDPNKKGGFNLGTKSSQTKDKSLDAPAKAEEKSFMSHVIDSVKAAGDFAQEALNASQDSPF